MILIPVFFPFGMMLMYDRGKLPLLGWIAASYRDIGQWRQTTASTLKEEEDDVALIRRPLCIIQYNYTLFNNHKLSCNTFINICLFIYYCFVNLLRWRFITASYSLSSTSLEDSLVILVSHQIKFVRLYKKLSIPKIMDSWKCVMI